MGMNLLVSSSRQVRKHKVIASLYAYTLIHADLYK